MQRRYVLWLRTHPRARSVLAGAFLAAFGAWAFLAGLRSARDSGAVAWIAFAASATVGALVQGCWNYVSIRKAFDVAARRDRLRRAIRLYHGSTVVAMLALFFFGGVVRAGGAGYAFGLVAMTLVGIAQADRLRRTQPGLDERRALGYAELMRGEPWLAFKDLPGHDEAVDQLWRVADEVRRRRWPRGRRGPRVLSVLVVGGTDEERTALVNATVIQARPRQVLRVGEAAWTNPERWWRDGLEVSHSRSSIAVLSDLDALPGGAASDARQLVQDLHSEGTDTLVIGTASSARAVDTVLRATFDTTVDVDAADYAPGSGSVAEPRGGLPWLAVGAVLGIGALAVGAEITAPEPWLAAPSQAHAITAVGPNCKHGDLTAHGVTHAIATHGLNSQVWDARAGSDFSSLVGRNAVAYVSSRPGPWSSNGMFVVAVYPSGMAAARAYDAIGGRRGVADSVVRHNAPSAATFRSYQEDNVVFFQYMPTGKGNATAADEVAYEMYLCGLTAS